MHILYIHQYFATPRGTTGTRSYEFAKRWAEKGNKITMVTTTAQLTDDDLKDSKGWFFKKLSAADINVIALHISYKQHMGILRRCLAFVTFVLVSSVLVLFIKNVDVIYATSTPLTIGIPALVAKLFRRIPFVFEVRDQWPEIPIELGIIKNKFLIKILLWLEKTIYKRSSAVVALSPGMADGVRSVINTEKPIAVIPNSCDTEVFRPDINGSGIRREKGWDDKLVLLHFGAIGKANGLEFVVEVAERLKSNTDVHFVIVGQGREKDSLVKKIMQSGLKNIEFFDSVPKTEMPGIVAACDVSIVIFANYPIIEHNSANKFFDSLSAGRPILLNYRGWQADVLEKNGAGFGCERCNLDEFVEKVLYLNSHRKELLQMGRNARLIAEEKFNRDKLAAQALVFLGEAK